MSEKVPSATPKEYGVPKEMSEGIFQTLIRCEGYSADEVMGMMPDAAYKLWSRDGSHISEEDVRRKIEHGAAVITLLPGLDSDAEVFIKHIRSFYRKYSGRREVLFAGLAIPGSADLLFAPDHAMTVADVSATKYVLMTLEWMRHLGLNGTNTVIDSHSSGGEAATLLSLYVRAIAGHPALHPTKDFTFSALRGANFFARLGEKVPLVGGKAVGYLETGIFAAMSGANEEPGLLQHHLDRANDAGGWGHDLKIWELSFADEAPSFRVNPKNLYLTGGERDVLTRWVKIKQWFIESWMSQKKTYIEEDKRDEIWREMTEWFPKDVHRLLRHDGSLYDPRAVEVITDKLIQLLQWMDRMPVIPIREHDLGMLRAKLANHDVDLRTSVLDAGYEDFGTFQKEFAHHDHTELPLADYVDPEIKRSVADFMGRVNSMSNDECDAWFEGDGRQVWRNLVVDILERGIAPDIWPDRFRAPRGGIELLFTSEELEAMRDGRLDFRDPQVRMRVASSPGWCEHYGWITNNEYQNSEYRGRGSRGQLLDPVLYRFTDIVIRRMSGLGIGESIFENEAIAELIDPGPRNNWDALRQWYEMWMIPKPKIID